MIINDLNHGIPEKDFIRIIDKITENAKVRKIILFGSRAKGNYRNGSDIDLAINAPGINMAELNEIKANIEDLNFPYFIDIIDIKNIVNQDLIDHIRRIGKDVYLYYGNKIEE